MPWKSQAFSVQTYHAAAEDVAISRGHHDAAVAVQRDASHHIAWPAALAPLSAQLGRHQGSSGSGSYQRSAMPSTEVFTLTETAAQRLEKQLWTLQVQLQLSSWRLNSLGSHRTRWQRC